MKTKFWTIGCIALAGGLALANHNGVAEQQNKDRTGAPGSDPTCAACHSGGSFDGGTFVMLTDLDNTTEFNSYTPGETYLLHILANGNAAGWGLQSTMLGPDHTTAGNFSNPSANGQLEFANNRSIFEHNDLSGSGTFTVQWTAPTEGTGDVTLYYAGIAANGNGGTGGDAAFTGSQTWVEGSVNVAETEALQPRVAAYDGAITITITGSEGVADVFDMTGRQVTSRRLSSVREHIATDDWQPAPYIVRVRTSGSAVPHTFRVYVH